MTAPTFTLTVDSTTGPCAVATVCGDLDLTNARRFVEAVTGIDPDHDVILDLSPLRYVDSAGLAAIDELLARRHVRVVVEPDSPVRAAAVLIGLPCHDSVTDAVQA